ncbi:MAG: hypothetical protein JWN74_3269 [Acidobacteriaceae bacterium]|nr:hypothetical protein [Acidobacteriaceae bacterium]
MNEKLIEVPVDGPVYSKRACFTNGPRVIVSDISDRGSTMISAHVALLAISSVQIGLSQSSRVA